jgi:hypothetical protein
MNKLTDWFHPSIKPVRIGAYQRDYIRGYTHYSYWNGRSFLTGTESIEEAGKGKYLVSWHQDLPWRGLAVEP